MNEYLYQQSYYEDLYDLHTVEECLEWYWGIRKKMETHRRDLKDMTDEEFKKDTHKALSYMVNIIKIERFRHRSERIQEWMDRDRKIQEIYDSAKAPDNVHCPDCSSEMKLMCTDLFDAYEKYPYVVFMFECVSCKKRISLYEDGRRWMCDPPKCPTCGSTLKNSMKRKKDVLTTTYKCTSCTYTRKEVDDFAKFRQEQDAREKHNKELLTKYKSEFCYNEKEGQDAVANMDGIVRLVNEWKEREKKEADPIFQKAMKLKKISIVEMEKLIVDAINSQKYIRFILGQPVMGRFVEVPFTAQDTDSNRSEYDSKNMLKKLIIKALEGTNWRLMSDGVMGRLGVLSGRLKGIEQENDLMEVIKDEKMS